MKPGRRKPNETALHRETRLPSRHPRPINDQMEQISKKLMNWASILDPQTREQAIVSAGMPFIFPHLALMPDAHLGKGATVGSVIPTVGAIIPAAVGVDIGCGMIAVRTQLVETELPAERARTACLHLRPPCRSAPASTTAMIDEPAAREIGGAGGDRRRGTGGRHQPELAASVGFAGFRKPFHRGVGRRGRSGLVVPALRFTRGREQAGDEAHQGGSAAVRQALDHAAQPRSGLSRRGRRRSSGPISRHCGGRSGSLPEPGRDDGAGNELFRGVDGPRGEA